MLVLSEILKTKLQWFKPVSQLALFELKKKTRDTAFGYAWLFVKPAVYIGVFWFALELGLKAGSSAQGPLPYIIWLMCGLIPWFFMTAMLGAGANTMNKFSYLVNKIKFPIAAIPTIVTVSEFIVHLCLIAALFVIYFLVGGTLDVYLLQVPVILVLLFLFWDSFSLLASMLSAMSKDFYQLLKALNTPLFWLSGIIFNTRNVGIDWVQTLLAFDPVSFFATSMRYALYSKEWVFADPVLCGGFAFCFILQVVLMVVVYKRTRKDIPDVV